MSDLPPGWEWATLDDVADWGSGGTPKAGTPEYYGGPIPWAVIGDLNDSTIQATASTITQRGLQESSAKLVPTDTLLIAMYGSIGKLGIAGVDMATNQAIAFAQPKAIDVKYLFWYLMSQRDNLNQAGKGATQKNISQAILRAWPIPVPPLAEQRRIVATLEDHLSRLKAAMRVIDRAPSARFTLEQSIFEAAATGKLSDQRPDDTPVDISLKEAQSRFTSTPPVGRRAARALPPRARSLLAKERIPATWRWVEWGRIGYSHNGAAFPSTDYAERGIRLIRPGNLGPDGKVAWHPVATRHLPNEYAERRSDLIVRGRALIMNLTAQSLKDQFLGRTCLKVEDEPALLNQRLAWLEAATGEVEYLLLVFRSPIFRRFVDELNTGSLIQHIHTWQVDKFMIPLPPIEEQRRIIGTVDEQLASLTRGVSLITRTSRRAESLRRAVLAEAFAGQLVPQDLSDEPASLLLERIRATRPTQPKRKQTRRSDNTTQETLP